MEKRTKKIWFQVKQIKEKGYALTIDVLLFLIAFAIILSMIFMLFNHFEKQKRIEEVSWRAYQIYKFLKAYYMRNLQLIKNNCGGFANCPYTLTPEPVDDNTFRIHTDNLALLRPLQRICKINQVDDTTFDITCISSYSGQPFQIELYNYQNFHQPYLYPYIGRYFAMKVKEPTLGTQFTFVLDKEINYSLTQTGSILKTLKSAIENWTLMRYQYAVGNACGDTATSPNDPVGGLGSWDDEKIPWVWQLLGDSPYEEVEGETRPVLCQNVEENCQCGNNCGCSNFDNFAVWPQDGSLCMISDGNIWLRILNNLNLGSSYMTDGFGNLLTFVPLADSEGNPINCPPPRPKCCYPTVSKKGRIGILDENGNWLYYVELIYPY